MRATLLSITAAATLAAFAAFSATPASATTCSPTIAGKVTPNSGCEIGNTNNDFLNNPPPPGTLQVNDDSLFGGGWSFIAKDDGLNGTDEGNTDALTITGTTLSGIWEIDLTGTGSNEALLVFKGGAGNIDPDEYVGYLMSAALIGTDLFLDGIYNTPFSSPGGQANISHVSLYGRVGVIPLPAALPLFLTALGGLGFIGWRRRKFATA